MILVLFLLSKQVCVINVFSKRLDHLLIILVMGIPRISGSWQFDGVVNLNVLAFGHNSCHAIKFSN